ncbi:MAG: hypothetical protein K2R98_00995 [Gemmataceae bacterium]|nr:hypothetical protein [Gemmataceae bacterium]
MQSDRERKALMQEARGKRRRRAARKEKLPNDEAPASKDESLPEKMMEVAEGAVEKLGDFASAMVHKIKDAVSETAAEPTVTPAVVIPAKKRTVRTRP